MYNNTTFNKCEDVALNDVAQNGNKTIIIRRDSGLSVNINDGHFDAKLPYDAKPAVACGSELVDSNVDSQINLYTLKREAAEEVLSPSGTPKQTACKRIKRGSSSEDNGDGKMRVGCPFHKKDPKMYQKGSCRGIGFAEMGKLKDHLKDVHCIPQGICKQKLNFKERKFTNLKTIDLKWKLVFRVLFPEIPKDEIPSPFSHEDIVKPVTPVIAGNDLNALRNTLKNILLDRYRIEVLCDDPDLVADFEILFDEAVAICKQGTTTAFTPGIKKEESQSIEQHSLLTPLSSNENSPQLRSRGLPNIDSSGLAVSPERTRQDFFEPYPSEVPEVKSEQSVPKFNMLDVPVPGFGQGNSALGDFNSHSSSHYTEPCIFNANFPSTFQFDFSIDIDTYLYRDHSTFATSPSPTPQPTNIKNPFMGSETPPCQNLTCFPHIDFAGPISPPSNCMDGMNEAFDIDEWLNLDTLTPRDKWSAKIKQEMHGFMDKMFYKRK